MRKRIRVKAYFKKEKRTPKVKQKDWKMRKEMLQKLRSIDTRKSKWKDEKINAVEGRRMVFNVIQYVDFGKRAFPPTS